MSLDLIILVQGYPFQKLDTIDAQAVGNVSILINTSIIPYQGEQLINEEVEPTKTCQ